MEPLELEQRKRVVTIAQEWISTKYRHGARIKQIAADCTFFAKVYEEAGLVPEVPIQVYNSMAHLHRASGQYLQHIRKYAHEVTVDKVKEGASRRYRDVPHRPRLLPRRRHQRSPMA